MSIKEFAWAWNETGLTAEEKLILMALAEGFCWPHMIAKKLEMELSDVQEILDFLVTRYVISFAISNDGTSYWISECKRRGDA